HLTPLYAALTENHIQVSRLLCRYGAEVDVRGDNNMTPLHCASIDGDRQLAQSLLSLGADPNARDDWGQTPLHSAAEMGIPNATRILLELDADANVRNYDDLTSLRTSQRASDRFDMDQASPVLCRIDVNARNFQRRTPLHLAAASGWGTRRLDAACALLEHGAYKTAMDMEGKTPFQIAAWFGHGEFMKLLL
ncbi:ankyrin repeat-containing domain protein, partial [Lactifluus volemus]